MSLKFQKKRTLSGEAAALETALRTGIRGEVRFDAVSRGLYATDASIYQIDPIAVVVPKDRDDVIHAMRVAAERGLRILPRGGGTSLAGQTAGEALVIDVSKYMIEVLETNEPERWVRVQPGRVRDELNALLAPTGLHFAPETATSNRANVGGMIGNNSSGTKSIVYGKTIDHVIELDIVLPTGEELHTRPMSREAWDAIAARDDREGRIYRRVRDLIEANREEIERRYPKVMRRVGGYNLDAFPEEGPWNLSHLIVGSEGTLATVLEAKLNLEPIPKAKAVSVAHFKSVNEALRAVVQIVPHGPSAVEILDRTVIGLAKENLETRKLTGWVEGDPAAVLIMEFFGDSMEEAEGKLEQLVEELKEKELGYAYPVMKDAAAQAEVWGVRGAGLGLMLGMKGDAKPTAFIEDSAVPLEVLPDYIEQVLEICAGVDVPVAMYAHASVGLIHVRPILDLKLERDIERMKIISEKTFELVQHYGGSWSGEHGDGLVRSYMNERFFGERLYAVFREIKQLFDPENLMNPGKIVDAPAMDQNLRFGPEYKVPARTTWYHYREDGGFDRAVEMCTGVGACRKTLGGTMCPSYIATRDEDHSTRGRANALRLAMSGQLGPDAMAGDELDRVFDLCLSCKGCKAECPSNVDVARLKGELLAHRHEERGAKLEERFFGFSPDLARMAAGPLAPLVNRGGTWAWARAAMETVIGLDRRRPLPAFAGETFPAWFEKREMERPAVEKHSERTVVLFDDTFINYHEPHVGQAAVRLLEALGYRVELARAGCCTRTLISKGFLEQARERGTKTLRRLKAFTDRGLPVVVCEPSCLSALTDDLPDLVHDVDMAKQVAAGTMMIDVFLEREIAAGRIDEETLKTLRESGDGAKFLIHGHCHQKALYGTAGMKSVLGQCNGAQVDEIPSGCCGMAGSFGYEKDHYELSMQIGEDRLFPAVRKMDPETQLIACGFSCRHQLNDGAGAKARHFVEVMADLMEGRA